MYFPRTYAVETPEKPAYIMATSGEVVTYGQLEERANRCAHLFRNCGLTTGDHIAIFMENNVHFLEIVWAARRTGLYYTTISRHLTVDEVEYIVNDCSAKILLTSHAMGDVAGSLVGRIPNVQHRIMVDGAIAGYVAYENLVEGCPKTPIADENQGADMLYSSGTTGRPKGIIIEEVGDNINEPLEPIWQEYFGFFEYSSGMVYLSTAPLYHTAPLRFGLMVHQYGGTLIVMERFDAAESLFLIEKYGATHSQWVPTMFVRMLKLPEAERNRYDVSSMKVAIHGAAPIAIPTKEQMIEWWGPIFTEYYGGTEGNGATMITSEEWLKHKGSVGRALLGEVRILDDDENELPPEKVGTIYFSSGNPFEYYNDPEKTAGSRSSSGWTTLGDVGFVDAEGYLYLTDRKADMIISGGVNIYPQEAENVLIIHPKVMDVAVFGIPNEEFGEEVKGVVQPKNMADAGSELEAELIAYCQKHLSKIKSPKSIDFKEALPRTPTGKLFKRRLKEVYWNRTDENRK
ncbi:MAG: acyl-CoA synthetase [Deltaproteobacteria bacterium]|nr:acyl-CoA synthetase [Deltaproteobacteria bacterium]